MDVRIVDKRHKSEWNDYVQANDHAIAWQSYDWSAVLAEHYRFTFYPLAVFNGEGIEGILPLYLLSNGRKRPVLISVPYAVAGGIVGDNDEAKKALLNRAVRISREHGSCPITLKQYKVKISGDLRIDDNYYNRELALSDNEEELVGRISERNRGIVEEVRNLDLVFEHASDDLNSFYSLLLHHHHRSGLPCVSKKWLVSLVKSGMYSFCIVKQRGVPVAGTMIKEFKKTVSFPFTCIRDHEARINSSAYWMYWKLINHYAEKGMKIFHSGRIPCTEQTDSYRLGWGGQKHRYYYQYYPTGLAYGGTEFITKRSVKRKIFEKCWKLLPRPFVSIVGPHIVCRFP